MEQLNKDQHIDVFKGFIEEQKKWMTKEPQHMKLYYDYAMGAIIYAELADTVDVKTIVEEQNKLISYWWYLKKKKKKRKKS